MKTFTPFLTVFGSIAGVVVPGFLSAGIYIPFYAVIMAGVLVAALIGYAIFTEPADQARTGSAFSTTRRSIRPAAVARMAPVARPVARPVQIRRRVRAIVEIAA